MQTSSVLSTLFADEYVNTYVAKCRAALSHAFRDQRLSYRSRNATGYKDTILTYVPFLRSNTTFK